MAPVLGIDLGCTKYLLALADAASGEVLARTRGTTRAGEGGDAFLARAREDIQQLAGSAGVDTTTIAAVGIGSPGPLDRHEGVLFAPPQLPWGEAYPLVARLRSALGRPDIPVAIDNDCKVGGIGELRAGAARGCSSMVYFGVGTGIGGCVVVDGDVQYGASGNASEIGHLCVWMGGPRCGCGADGCLEGIASGSGMERRGRAAIAAGESPALLDAAGGDAANVTGGMIAELAAAGDEACARIWHDAQFAMGAAVGSMVNALSPEVVVLGGGIAARHGEPYRGLVAAEARRRALGPNASHVDVRLAQLGEDSVLRGAIELARDLTR